MLQSGFGEITKFNFPGKNIVGDNQHVGLVKNTEREHSENHYPKSVQCPTSTCAESIPEKCNSKEVQPMHQSRCNVQSSDNFTVNVQQSSFASSIEETPHRDQPVNDVKCHDRCSGNPWQQACVHSQYGSRQQDPAVVATPVQQVDDSTAPCCDHEVDDRNGHAFDVSPQTSTVNDDACGRCRRDGSHAGSDVQHGDREETGGEGTQIQEAKLQGKCGELRADLRMQHSSLPPEGQRSSLPSISTKCRDLELQCGSEANGLSSGSELFLRTDANSVHLQEGRTQLHASVSPVPKTAGVWEPMRVLPQWIEDTKAQEYERMYHQRATLERSPNHKNTKSTSSRPLEIDSSSSGTEEPMVRQSPSSSPKIKGSKRGGHCHHDWNHRGSNAYQKMRTCRLCGLQEVTKFKDQITVQRWAEPTAKPSKTSKSKKEPLRSVSP